MLTWISIFRIFKQISNHFSRPFWWLHVSASNGQRQPKCMHVPVWHWLWPISFPIPLIHSLSVYRLLATLINEISENSRASESVVVLRLNEYKLLLLSKKKLLPIFSVIIWQLPSMSLYLFAFYVIHIQTQHIWCNTYGWLGMHVKISINQSMLHLVPMNKVQLNRWSMHIFQLS